MYVKVLTFQISEADRGPEAFREFVVRIANRNVLALRAYGLLDGYVVRISEDTILTINFYETEAEGKQAFANVTGAPEYARSMGLTMLHLQEGEGYDLPLSLTIEDLE
jgi:hypothetical protein